ncbi:hypothetical protein [Streptomyces rimosus]|uniref:hypothetical protein n=1 Tax=Streptomyces rimosus TaxID=1927 RepID=UPI0004C82D06|nr:hypothetical protein [Streptomyces rimosus]
MSKLTKQMIVPGQVWADKDRRRQGRTVLVDKVDDYYVHVTTLTNSLRTQSQVDAGRHQLDKRNLTSKVLRSRFGSDCYRLLSQDKVAVLQFPYACANGQPHKWLPVQTFLSSLPHAEVVLVCQRLDCLAHTIRRSRYVTDAVLPGELAA